ncbi:MAG: heme o synthase [Rickettsiaceae bacterium]
MTSNCSGVLDENIINSSIKDYFSLMKPRVMSLVVFTSLIGMILAPGVIHPFIGFVSILCTILASGSAGAINMWYDGDIDALMKRTRRRPIVTGRISKDEALSFGLVIGFFSILLMALCVNILSAFLLFFAIFYYVIIYTICLKRSSIYNVVIGGVSGALPPVIGWISVTGEVSLNSIWLFLIIFFWTPPHSWAIALNCLQDYKNANIPMMPIVKGDLYTKKQIIYYSIIMVLVSFVPCFLKISGIIYFLVALFGGIIFLYYSCILYRDHSNKTSKHFFIYSILYLFLLFLSMIL